VKKYWASSFKAKFILASICFCLSHLHFLVWSLLSSCLHTKKASVKVKTNTYLNKFGFIFPVIIPNGIGICKFLMHNTFQFKKSFRFRGSCIFSIQKSAKTMYIYISYWNFNWKDSRCSLLYVFIHLWFFLLLVWKRSNPVFSWPAKLLSMALITPKDLALNCIFLGDMREAV